MHEENKESESVLNDQGSEPSNHLSDVEDIEEIQPVEEASSLT